MAVRDSLGGPEERKSAQMMIADGEFDEFKFKDALGSYLQLLGMNPTTDEEYHALFQATECSYRLLRVKDGFDYLQRLMDNPLYFDSLGVLKLKQAEGYEINDDLEQAEALYTDVAENTENARLKAEAYYKLGLIYQFDYDRLPEAKEFYDKSVEANRRSEFADDALQRSSDIGKLKTYAHATLDTTATVEQIDDAADTQYRLAELYWFKLNKPDTAIQEMQYLVDSFPTAYVAPHAMVALAEMIRDYKADTATADSLLHEVLVKYPRSDYVAQALEALGLAGTAADTGYAYYHIRKAEDFLLDSANVDSARRHYQIVVDSFPESDYYLQARFNLIWLTQQYDNPGDSTVIYAYQALIDSFPGTPEARQAQQLLGQPGYNRTTQQQPVDTTTAAGQHLAAEGETADTSAQQQEDTSKYIDPLIALYRGPDGDTLTKLDAKPIEVDRPFEFPVEAAGLPNDQFYLYFQILLDFSGRVVDYKLKVPSGNEELDRRAKEAVETMTFDPLKMSKLISQYDLKTDKTGRGYWFVYEFPVEKPEHLR
ncbi:MAG: hypothetical protein D6800_13160 [Candidatus Zixiibacteriota bacterium]|nr:MAG: hypothetical protein D6800_13160 [candidate division Zixibacteria bacterium]